MILEPFLNDSWVILKWFPNHSENHFRMVQELPRISWESSQNSLRITQESFQNVLRITKNYTRIICEWFKDLQELLENHLRITWELPSDSWWSLNHSQMILEWYLVILKPFWNDSHIILSIFLTKWFLSDTLTILKWFLSNSSVILGYSQIVLK